MKRLMSASAACLMAVTAVPAQSDLGTPAFVMTVDFDQWNADFPGSTLAQIWDEPAVQSMRTQALRSFAGDVGVAPEALSQSFTGQMGLAVMMQGGGTTMPSFTYGLAFRQPGQGEAVAEQIRSAAAQGGETVDDQLLVSEDVAVLGDSAPLREALARQFSEGATGLGIAPAEGSFTNMRLNLAALAGAAPTDAQGRQAMNALGLGNLDAMEASGGFFGTGLAWNWDILTQGARSGVMDLIGPPGEFQTLSAVPQDVASVSAARLQPLTRILDMIQQAMMASGDPMAQQQFQQMMMMPAMFGIDVQSILAAIGPEVTVADRAGEKAVIMQSSNPQLIMQTIQTFAGGMGGMMMGGMGAQPGEMPAPPRQVTEGGTTFTVMEMPGGLTLSMGEVNGNLVIAQGEGLMRDVIGSSAGGPNVTQGALWQSAGEQLGEPTSLLAISDDAAIVRQMAGEPEMLMMMGLDQQTVGSLQEVADVIARHGGHSVTTLSTAPDRLSLQLNSSSGIEVLGILMMMATASDMQSAGMQMTPMEPTMTPMPTSPKP